MKTFPKIFYVAKFLNTLYTKFIEVIENKKLKKKNSNDRYEISGAQDISISITHTIYARCMFLVLHHPANQKPPLD